MPFGDVLLSALLHLVLSRVRPRKQKRRLVEQFDEEFGIVRWRWRSQDWEASVRLTDPVADAIVRIDGDRDGPYRDSRDRAYELVDSWPEIAAGPLAQAITRRERLGDSLGPYRTGDDVDVAYERHALKKVWLDARDETASVKAKVRGRRRLVKVSLHD